MWGGVRDAHLEDGQEPEPAILSLQPVQPLGRVVQCERRTARRSCVVPDEKEYAQWIRPHD